MSAMYRVHIGYSATGRNRWRYFDSIDTARAFVGAVFARTGIVLSVVRTA